jgi:O-antigen/teichoic acid export membrane protein
MKIIRILEITWLLIAIAGAGIGVYKFTSEGWDEALYFFIFTFVAAIFYYIRRRQRIRMEQDNRPGE